MNQPPDPRGGRRQHLLAAAVAAAALLLVTSSCGASGNLGEPNPVSLSQPQCVEGWNRGIFQLAPGKGPPLPSTLSLGLIAPHILATSGYTCDFAFVFPHNVTLIVSGGGINDAAESARDGLVWTPSGPPMANYEPSIEPATTLPRSWHPACQLASGKITLRTPCPPMSGDVPRYPLMSKLRGVTGLPMGGLKPPAYWLGRSFRAQPGYLIGATYQEIHPVPVVSVSYNVATVNGDQWIVKVSSVRGHFNRLGPCWVVHQCDARSPNLTIPSVAYVGNIHPTPASTVIVSSRLEIRGRTALTSAARLAELRQPMPAWLVEQVLRALKPIPAGFRQLADR